MRHVSIRPISTVTFVIAPQASPDFSVKFLFLALQTLAKTQETVRIQQISAIIRVNAQLNTLEVIAKHRFRANFTHVQ